VRRLGEDNVADRAGIVLHDLPAEHRVAAFLKQRDDRSPARIRRLGSRVADGQHEASDGARRRRFVLFTAHPIMLTLVDKIAV
jgi:hypothetical protein